MPWARNLEDVLADQESRLAGLTSDEVRARLERFGPNQLRQARKASVWQILYNQIQSVIIALLIAASVLSFAVGDTIEGAAIAVTIAITIVLGFVTELRAVRSMEALRLLGSVKARVRRDGAEHEVDAASLVPGDVVVFEGGDRITADVRVIEASKLQSDESALTGESVPVRKRTDAVEIDAPLAERSSMLYKGATVTRGAGAGIVVGTGMATELGRIAELVDQADEEATPLEQRLESLGQRLLWVCLAIAATTTLIGIATGRPTMLMIETGIALAIAAIPEGLPVVATVALARGMWRLSARHALIKRLSAVETLGATGVIVTDKTGTLTENRMSVVALVVGEREYAVPGDLEDDPEAQSSVRRALELCALCNNAVIAADGSTGDPLEVALLRAALLVGIDRAALVESQPEVREEAFDADIKMMATVHDVGNHLRVAVKGAPEAVMDACKGMSTEETASVMSRGEAMAARGLRVLAVAEKSAAAPDDDVYVDLELVALVGLADPPRRDVEAPLAACRAAGIRVVMATGDQHVTATAIARAVGLIDADAEVISGRELKRMDEMTAAERERARGAQVFARVTPEQKLDIIALHQEAGTVVAMTGDGVNDAPALRKAEIGVAMGQRGTDVAREAAAMVLRDDSFESIVVAVEQGRAIFENLRRFVLYLLSCNISEILIVTGAVMVAAPLPLLPLQILFLNLVTDVFPALALGFGEGDPSSMTRPPRDAREPIIARRHWLAMVGYAFLITCAVLGAMAIAHGAGASKAEATTVSFLTLGFAQLWHVLNMRGRASRVINNDVVRSPWIWGALALCVVLMLCFALISPLATVLSVVPLSGSQWGLVLGASFVPLVVGQLILIARPVR